jgi:predicted outer membrane protein
VLRRIARLARLLVVAIVLAALVTVVYQTWTSGAPGVNGWTQTQWGPLSPADRDLIVRVRLAGLWEHPVGEQAAQQAQSPIVRDVAAKISAEHVALDDATQKIANQLGVVLPASPSDQQVGWMKQIAAQTGSDYDRTFVQLLRAAHGQILPIIATVRAETRNDLVRAFADTGAAYVSRHIGYLESTGLVDYSQLPVVSPGLFGGGVTLADLTVPILVFVASLLVALALMLAAQERRTGRNRRPPVQAGPPTAPLPVVAPGPGTKPAGLHRRRAPPPPRSK